MNVYNVRRAFNQYYYLIFDRGGFKRLLYRRSSNSVPIYTLKNKGSKKGVLELFSVLKGSLLALMVPH